MWVFILAAAGVLAQEPTREDFGYGCSSRNGIPALGVRPLLLIMVEHEGQNSFVRDAAYHQDRVFDYDGAMARSSLNGYMWENSNHRFRWYPAAPAPVFVTMPDTASADTLIVRYPPATFGQEFEFRWFRYIIKEVMKQRLFPFEDFDQDGDGVVEAEELGILILAAEDGLGMTRTPGLIEGSLVDVNAGRMAAANQIADHRNIIDFNIMVHEQVHILGMADLYGPTECVLSKCFSLAADRTSPMVINEIYHLDPWHKLVHGWIDPVIASVKEDGTAILRAPQCGFDLGKECLILYHPDYPLDEFFMVEFRNMSTSCDNQFDTDVGGAGVVIWHLWRDRATCNLRAESLPCPSGLTVMMQTVGAPDLEIGGSEEWDEGETTPLLRWYDPDRPEPLPIRLTVVGDAVAGESILVSWDSDGDIVWVDFNYGGVEAGTFAQPYNTVKEAVAHLPAPDTIYLKPGTSPEALRIVDPVVLKSFAGTATIGGP
ncbi:MAG: hypothetical protein ABIK96_16425 [bacterium]